MKAFKKKWNSTNPKAYSIANDAVAKDAFRNVAARMGYGTASLAEATEYDLIRWTNNYWLMITLFRNHWIARRIVEKPAQDMCKAWPTLTCEIDPKQVSKFDRTISRTLTPARVQKSLKWARLFGGGGALMVIDGHEDILEEPLDYDDVAPDSYKGLIVFDRWSGITPDGPVADDINSPVDFGYPEYYTVHGETGESFNVHHSRILRFTGPDVPNPEHQATMYWGISELELAYEELRKRDNMSWSVLQLLYRAQIMTQKNPELAKLLSGAFGSQQAAVKFGQVMQAQNELLSNQSMLVLGEDGELQSHQYTFGGISDVYQMFRQDLCGCARMPEVILFGIQSKGLGTSDEGDIRNYEMDISLKQNEDMKPQLDKLYPVVSMSEFGEVPDDLDFSFPSVRVLTEEQKATLQKDGAASILEVFGAGVRSQKASLKELKILSEKTDIGTTINDEEIEAADDKVTTPLEIEQAEARAGTEEFEEKEVPKSKATDAAWQESDHPRGEGGKFALAQGQSTEGKYKSSTGEWSTKRKSLHSDIVGKLLSGKKGGNNPQAYVLGGGSASGKSTGFQRMYAEKFKDEIVSIDSDLIKEMIPEYEHLKKIDPTNAARLVHEESSHLAKQAMAVAIAKKIDFVYDSTGSGKELPKIAERLNGEGYKVHAMYFDVPLDEARNRAGARAKRTGRHISEEVLQSTHQGSAQGFMNLKESKHVTTAKLYSNVEKIPALVYSKGEGQTGVVVDQNAWKSYQEKAGV